MYLCPCQTLLTVSEAQLVEIEGGHGEDPLMRPPQGTQTAGAVTELLKPCFCQHETAQHQLSSSHVSAKSSEKSIQPSNNICVLARPLTLTQPSACFAHLVTDRSEHMCVSTVLPAWWPKSLTLLQQCLNSVLSCLGLSLLFYRSAPLCA